MIKKTEKKPKQIEIVSIRNMSGTCSDLWHDDNLIIYKFDGFLVELLFYI